MRVKITFKNGKTQDFICDYVEWADLRDDSEGDFLFMQNSDKEDEDNYLTKYVISKSEISSLEVVQR